MASYSASVTHRSYFALTAVWRATNSQRNALLGGSQVAASASDFCWFAGPSTANRFSGPLAKRARCSSDNCWAPFCQASDNATTRSICTALDVAAPRIKSRSEEHKTELQSRGHLLCRRLLE